VRSRAEPRELRITDRAARDIAAIWESRCLTESRERAHRSLRWLVIAVKNLPFTPLASPINPDTGARERAVGKLTIIYDVEPVAGIDPCAGHVNVLGILERCCVHDITV
jgi:hypothetical protein